MINEYTSFNNCMADRNLFSGDNVPPDFHYLAYCTSVRQKQGSYSLASCLPVHHYFHT